MKKNRVEVLCFLVLGMIVFGLGTGCDVEDKVYYGDYRISNQADLARLSGYTEITGDLLVGRVTLYMFELEPPDMVKALGLFKNLDGLESLRTIGGSLQIGYPGYLSLPKSIPSLENIDGLCNLESVGGSIIVYGENSLKNLDGFRSLKTVGGSFDIGCYTLTSLEALNNLISVGGTLQLTDQAFLTTMKGLDNLSSLGGLTISYNKQLANLDGLENVSILNGNIKINNNSSLESITGLTSLTSIAGALEIKSNAVLESMPGLTNLTDIGADYKTGLVISYNPALLDLNDLSRLTSLAGNLHMYCNSETVDSESEAFKDRLTADGWDKCWDLTCDGESILVCPSEE